MKQLGLEIDDLNQRITVRSDALLLLADTNPRFPSRFEHARAKRQHWSDSEPDKAVRS